MCISMLFFIRISELLFCKINSEELFEKFNVACATLIIQKQITEQTDITTIFDALISLLIFFTSCARPACPP